jgi:hypothetical protein
MHNTHPELIDLLTFAINGAELAVLAAIVPDSLERFSVDSADLGLGFRETVRDRYEELTHALLVTGRLSR